MAEHSISDFLFIVGMSFIRTWICADIPFGYHERICSSPFGRLLLSTAMDVDLDSTCPVVNTGKENILGIRGHLRPVAEHVSLL